MSKMSIADQINYYDKQRESVMVRIVGVTDETLLEQLRDEYLDLELTIQRLQQEQEAETANRHADELVREHKDRYIRTREIESAIEITNDLPTGSVQALIKAKRMRPITGDRRSLLMLANVLSATIHLKDLTDVVLDTIGTGKRDLSLYRYCVSEYESVGDYFAVAKNKV